MKNQQLFTLGYEGLDIEDFIARLKEVGVKAVVDVRELPLSRKKGYSKTALRDALAGSDIGYFHANLLGCPKKVRDQYREDQDWQRYTRDFLAYIQTQDFSIRELVKFSNATTTCLVCYEADFSMCHRSYVARAAHQAGAPGVFHLTAKTVFPDRSLKVAA